MASSRFNIFFLCEDVPALGRASDLKEKLADNCGHKVNINGYFCDYARLCHPKLKQAATDHAIAADLLIISAHGTDPIPTFVRKWMNDVAALRADKIPCAEFLNSASPETAKIFHDFLNQWAAQNGSLLFSNLFPGILPAAIARRN